MKYSEFKQRVIDIGFNVEDEAREVWVVDDEGDIVATVSTDITSSMDTDYIASKEQGEDVRREILDLNYKLSKTPLTERENEKKYNVILPNILRDRKPILLCKSFDDHESCGIDWSPKDWLDDNMDRLILQNKKSKTLTNDILLLKLR